MLPADLEERLADLAERAVPDRLHQGREDVLFARRGLLDQVGELVEDERALRPVLEPTEPAESSAVCVELVKADEADFIGVGSLQVPGKQATHDRHSGAAQQQPRLARGPAPGPR